MSDFEVPQPIICSPFEEPTKHWSLEPGDAPTEPSAGRRSAGYFYPAAQEDAEGEPAGALVELTLVNLIRTRVEFWREAGYPKAAAAGRRAVNADGQYGDWRYTMARKVAEVRDVLDRL